MAYTKDAYQNAATKAATYALNVADAATSTRPRASLAQVDITDESGTEGFFKQRPTAVAKKDSMFRDDVMSQLYAQNIELQNQANIYGDQIRREEDKITKALGINLSSGPMEGITSGPEEVSDTVIKIVDAISMAESSGGKNTNHPLVKKGQYKGQRAIGEYAIMPGNVPQWTKQAFGYEMSVEDFKDNPAAQAYVTEYKINEYYNKYGTVEDAASVWFTGQPVEKAGNVSDGYTTAPEYLEKFMGFYKNPRR